MSTAKQRAGHWDDAYTKRGTEGVSWFQSDPAVSLDLIDALGVSPGTSVIDVGGGASLLVDRLVAAGFGDVSVLDVSEVALSAGSERIGAAPQVSWLHEDVLAWRPRRRFGLWHDRAVFHFLTDSQDRATYLENMWSGIESGGALIMATFADDGPGYCSGLPASRYSAEELVAILGPSFRLVSSKRELHTTPGGAIQPFTWVAGRISLLGQGSG